MAIIRRNKLNSIDTPLNEFTKELTNNQETVDSLNDYLISSSVAMKEINRQISKHITEEVTVKQPRTKDELRKAIMLAQLKVDVYSQ